MVLTKVQLKLPKTTLEWLPKVAAAHKDKKQKPEPLTPRAWVFDQLRQVAINQGQGVNLLRSKGFVEIPKEGTRDGKKVRIEVEALNVAKFAPKTDLDGSNFSAELSQKLLERLGFAVALLQAYIREGMLMGNEAFDNLEDWASDQITRSVASAYTDLENRELEEEESPEEPESGKSQ